MARKKELIKVKSGLSVIRSYRKKNFKPSVLEAIEDAKIGGEAYDEIVKLVSSKRLYIMEGTFTNSRLTFFEVARERKDPESLQERINRLTIAGSILVGEIERLERLQANEKLEIRKDKLRWQKVNGKKSS